jgi:hypothetical protein
MNRRISEAIQQCDQIIAESQDCAAELNLYLGAISRHSDWTERDIVDLLRALTIHFANQLCELRS